ncbi:unnamed protein product, partial [Lampetra fluviatilis]
DDGRRGRDNPRGRAGGETSDAVTNNARRDPETRRLCVPPAPEVDAARHRRHNSAGGRLRSSPPSSAALTAAAPPPPPPTGRTARRHLAALGNSLVVPLSRAPRRASLRPQRAWGGQRFSSSLPDLTAAAVVPFGGRGAPGRRKRHKITGAASWSASPSHAERLALARRYVSSFCLCSQGVCVPLSLWP